MNASEPNSNIQARWIVHLDMDSFFVSVERLKNPRLNDKPVAVGGKGPRSVISSASYEARAFGVKSAMATEQAIRLCPQLILVPPSFSDYSQISDKIFSYIKTLSPKYEMVSIDEAYLDLTGCEKLYPPRIEFGFNLKNKVKEISDLNCSIGIASNKMIAKIASDFCKPNGLLEILPGTEREFIAPMTIDKIPGIGKKTALYLNANGIHTCNDLALKTDLWVLQNLEHGGAEWKQKALGISTSLVEEGGERKSLSAEETFIKDVANLEQLKKTLLDLSEEIGFDLRREGLMAKTIQIKYRYPDFSTFTRAQTLPEPTDLSEKIGKIAYELLIKNKNKVKPLRLLGLKLGGFVTKVEYAKIPRQLDLFTNYKIDTKKNKLQEVKDQLKIKFGKNIFLTQKEKLDKKN